MIQKQEIIEWFQQQKSHQRLDLLCSLFNHCVPPENHFLKSCILMFAKRDSFPAQDYEFVSSFYRNDFTWDPEVVGISDESVRRRLTFFLALLEGNRRQEAHSIYMLLVSPATTAYLENFKQKGNGSAQFPSKESENTCNELLLIYTMALHHPVFTHHERTQFGLLHRMLVDSISKTERHGTSPVNTQDTSQPNHCPARSRTSGSPPSFEKTADEQKPVRNVTSDATSQVKTPLHNVRRHNSGRSNRRYSGIRGEGSSSKSFETPADASIKGRDSGSSLDSLVNNLQERLQRDCSVSSPTFQQLLNKFSVSDLACMSDNQLQKLGLSSTLVVQFRQSLNTKSSSKHPSSNGLSDFASKRVPSVAYASEDQYYQQYPPLRPEKSTSPKSGPANPNLVPANSSDSPGQHPESATPPNLHEQSRDAQSVNLSSAANNVSSFNYPTAPGPGYTGYPMNLPQQQQPQQLARAPSQPRELPRLARLPIALSFSAPAQPNAYYFASNASGSGMEPVALVPAQQIISLGQISPGSELQQPAFAIPAAAGHPGAAQAVAYPVTGGLLVQGQLGPQPLGSASSRPGSVLEMPTAVSPCPLFFSPMDMDFTRPPPQIMPARISCYNCGGEGHRGDDCAELANEESNPS